MVLKEDMADEMSLRAAPTDRLETGQDYPEEDKEKNSLKEDMAEEMSFTTAPTNEAETIQGHPEEEKEIAKKILQKRCILQ